jgi:galactitol-specific phosphotransferase system IIB component
MLNGEKLERIFISCPTVKIFIENKERSVFYTSSLKDVGGRDNDVYDNIMYVYDHGNLNKAINIKSFYRLGTSTMIQVKIESAASQENIYHIFQEALETAILSETDFGNNWYNIITFFENLKTIAYLLSDDESNLEIIKDIYRYLRFMQYISNEVDIKLIKEKYDLFKARKIVPNDTPPFCKLSNIVNILGDEAGGIMPRGNIYPINMMYEDNKFSTDIAVFKYFPPLKGSTFRLHRKAESVRRIAPEDPIHPQPYCHPLRRRKPHRKHSQQRKAQDRLYKN